jgi:hypothetical protein
MKPHQKAELLNGILQHLKYKVASGVYLILPSSQDGRVNTVKKPMIVR